MNNRTEIKKSTIINDGIMNFGKISGNVNQSIQQLPENQDELKQLLSQLQSLLENSSLTDEDKTDALEQTQEIAEASAQSKPEKHSVFRKALRYFNGLASELSDVPETLVKFGSLIENLSKILI